MPLKPFLDKVKSKKARVGVLGLGYVGLPLAMAFVKNGFSVTGIDTDSRKVRQLNDGKSYILDVSSDTVREAVRSRLFRAVDHYRVVSDLDAVIICVPTPLSKSKDPIPDITLVRQSAEMLSRYLKKGQLVILESTSYPGTTEDELGPILEKSGLHAEKDFFLAFSPERVDPGNQQFDTVNIPKIVGGVGSQSTAAAKALYSAVIRRVIEVSSAKTAEMAKLLENTFRSVNIALINEFAQIADRLGVDIWEVIEAAKTKPFGFMAFYPGPGIGGHCLPIDPMYLSWKSKQEGFDADLIIDLAAKVNERMPLYVVEKTGRLLNERQRALKNSEVLVLGVAYKRDVDDVRESPALAVIEHLLKRKCKVVYSDPYVPSIRVSGKTLRSARLSAALLKRQDCVILLTDHKKFDADEIVRHASLLLDTRNAFRKYHPRKNLYFL